MSDTPQDATQVQDPLDTAAELLFKALMDLPKGMEDFRIQESSRTILMLAQTTAMIDIAQSLRVMNQSLKEIDARLEFIAGELEHGHP